MRYVLNMQTTPEKKLCRRGGFDRAWADVLYDDNGVLLTDPNAGSGVHYHNHDHHHVGGNRNPILLMYECTWGDKSRQLFDARQDRISLLDESTGYWTDLITGKGSYGSYWTNAFLQDTVIFTNDVDNVLAYPKGGVMQEIPSLRDTMKVTKARVAVEFNGCVLLMNVVQDGVRQASRIVWCDLNLPLDWDQGKVGTVAGQQDLDLGDEILNAAVMLGSLYIYTRRKIWRCMVANDPSTVFSFQTVYSEPKNQTGCLTYPRTLVCAGAAHYYMSRDGIYKYSPYVAEPIREDWMHRAAGVIFVKADTAMAGVQCVAPVAEFIPRTREIIFSWPVGTRTINTMSLVIQIDHQAADIVDAGFTAFCNYRRSPLATQLCDEVQDLLCASGIDYCIKSFGGIFFREYADLSGGDPSNDIPLADNTYSEGGYYSELRGLLPLGFTDREKIVRNVLVDDDVTEQSNPQNYRVWLGNSFNLADPNDMDDYCAVNWRDLGTKPVQCIDGAKISQMQAKHLKAAIGKEWRCFDQNRYLYFRLRIESPTGGPAIGADTCISSIAFDAMAMPKP